MKRNEFEKSNEKNLCNFCSYVFRVPIIWAEWTKSILWDWNRNGSWRPFRKMGKYEYVSLTIAG